MSLNHQKSSLSHWKDMVLGLVTEIAVPVFACILISAIVIWNGTRMPKYLEINPSNVPIYSNAYNISQQGPIDEYGAEVYSWSFSSDDSPDMVWQFYSDEMSQKWGFYDVSSPQSSEKSLIVQSCPFYYLEMSSNPIDNTTYNYIIKFSKELCR